MRSRPHDIQLSSGCRIKPAGALGEFFYLDDVFRRHIPELVKMLKTPLIFYRVIQFPNKVTAADFDLEGPADETFRRPHFKDYGIDPASGVKPGTVGDQLE